MFHLKRNLSVDDVNIRRKPVYDPSDRIRVEKGHRTSHDPKQEFFVDQLRGLGTAQQEGQVHGHLWDLTRPVLTML